jgi:hypothetical protein
MIEPQISVDRKLLQTVLEDLVFLEKEWGGDISDDTIRRNSPTLRYLLVDGKLKDAGAMLNQRIRILTPESALEKNIPDIESTTFFMSAGAKISNGFVESVRHINRALSAEEVKRNYDESKRLSGSSIPLSIDSFLSQISFVYEKARINKREVIKYVANKLGGAHYDSKRVKINSTEGLSKEEEKFPLLDAISEQMKILDRNPIFLEMIGIGQRVINSSDVKKLKRQIRELK